jgi:hypothetical protein
MHASIIRDKNDGISGHYRVRVVYCGNQMVRDFHTRLTGKRLTPAKKPSQRWLV